MDRGSSSTLFDVVARLRSGESASSRDLDEACREARVLIDQLRALESREEAMLGRLRERDVALAELRASAEATRVETASLGKIKECARGNSNHRFLGFWFDSHAGRLPKSDWSVVLT